MILDKYQKAAVCDEHKACIVNANVGSGKTTVLIEKIRYLEKEKQVDLKDMVVLTFTNKAADEIKERLGQQTEDLWFGTFHGVAMRLLQQVLPVEELGLSKEFQVMLPEEEEELAKRLIHTHDLTIKYKNRLKKRMEDWYRKKKNSYEDDLQELIRCLEQEKQRQNKMTYRDLILYAADLLKRYPEVFHPGWLIIDEVQDCDEAQMDLIDALKKEDTSLFAVGDPNQVIYGWRGSAFQIFSLLKKKYDAEELSLPVNYRSSKIILQAAARFKQNGQNLIPMAEDGEKLRITAHYDPFSEADYLAGKIVELYLQGVPYEEIGIFYRLQNQADILERVFEKQKIPFEVSKNQSLQDIPIISWLYHLCRYLVNGEDESSLIRILTDKQYGDHLTEKKVIKLIQEEHTDEILLLQQIGKIFSFCSPYQIPEEDDLTKIWEIIGLDDRIGRTSASYEEDRANARSFFEQMKKSHQTMADFVNGAALHGLTSLDKQEESKDRVSLMTLHASKGLEFSYVFIIGVNPGLLPLRGTTEIQEEEERRLFFVGMTRAKKYLELSYYQSSPYPGMLSGPSPYLRLIKSEWVEGVILEKKDPKQAARHLQNLKKELLKQRMNKETDRPTDEKEKSRIRISHPRYGLGWIISEDEEKIVFDFDDFGEKEMIRMFASYSVVE